MSGIGIVDLLTWLQQQGYSVNIGDVLNIISAPFKTLGEWVYNAFSKIGEWVYSGIRLIYEAIVWINQQVYLFIKWLWEGILYINKLILEAILNAITWLWNGVLWLYGLIVSWVNSVWEFISKKWYQILALLKSQWIVHKLDEKWQPKGIVGTLFKYPVLEFTGLLAFMFNSLFIKNLVENLRKAWTITKHGIYRAETIFAKGKIIIYDNFSERLLSIMGSGRIQIYDNISIIELTIYASGTLYIEA